MLLMAWSRDSPSAIRPGKLKIAGTRKPPFEHAPLRSSPLPRIAASPVRPVACAPVAELLGRVPVIAS